jgi:hypothetical protein
MDLKLSIPFPEDLTKEAGWVQLDKYLYFIARVHLHIEQNQTRELAFGDILRTYHTTPYAETEVLKSFEEEFTTVDLKETTRSITLSKDLSRKITTTIAGAAKYPFYEVASTLGASLEQTIRSSVAESLRSADTLTRREKKVFTVSQRVKSGAQELQLAVAGYRRYSQSVYLHYIDYLFVEYRPTTFGLRKRNGTWAARSGYSRQRIPAYPFVPFVLLEPGSRKLAPVYRDGISKPAKSYTPRPGHV